MFRVVVIVVVVVDDDFIEHSLSNFKLYKGVDETLSPS